MSDTLARELLRSTASLIKADSINLDIYRQPAWVDDGAGGRRRATGSPTRIGSQRVHRAGVNSVSLPTANDEGITRVHEIVLIGMPCDAYGLRSFNVQVGDRFDFDDDSFLVHSIHHDRRYQIKALCRLVAS